MTQPTRVNPTFIWVGLGSALVLAGLLSPFASPHPDGLNRVAEDLGFHTAEAEDAPAHKLPFAQIFDGYAVKGVPEGVATTLAGIAGTVVTFGVAWGVGKLAVRRANATDPSSLDSDTHNS
ncbi:MAG TPA: PDGLE domain-containing protein [Leptolyngbyaceae cyanobacterium]